MGKARFWTIIALSLVALIVVAVPASADGQMGVWRDINPDAYISPPANPQLNSIYMLSPIEGWAVGDSRPTQNSTATSPACPPTCPSTNALPAIFHYDGSTWNLVPAPQFPNFPSTPSAYNLTSISFGPPNNPLSKNDGWAVGFNSTIGCVGTPSCPPTALALHWDGVTWRSQVAGLSGSNAGPVWSTFMVSSTDVWAVGQTQAGQGVFWHWTGVPGLGGGWNTPQNPITCPVTGPSCGVFSVFMVSPTEGWAVGAQGVIYHYFGGSWNSFVSPVTTALTSVFMLSPTEGWAAGDGGVIIHYSAGTWSGPVSPGTTSNDLFSIFMTSSTDGWAFGAKGTILHYSGGSWNVLPSNLVPTSPVVWFNFTSSFFNAPIDGWVVGTDGVVVHFDGASYGTITSPKINNFTSISFGPPWTPINPNDGWAVGNASSTTFEPTIYHWNGFAWTKGVAIGTTNNLNSVFMINSGDIWAVGGGPHTTASCSASLCPVILHFTGGSWNSVTPPPGSFSLKSVFMVSPTEGWAVGEQTSTQPASLTCKNGNCPVGIILHYTVSGGVGTWGIFPSPSTPPPLPGLNSVFMLNQNEGWAVGDNATILHYTVSGGVGAWNLVTVSGTPTLSPSANLTSIFMLSPTSGWIVGGIQASNSPSGLPAGSFSAGPVMLFWDGTKWEPVAVPSIPGGISPTGHTSATLKSVFFSPQPSGQPNANDGWAVGFPGKLVATILHWDGISWRHVTLSPALLGQVPPILTSLYMTSPANGWIVGSSPDFTSTAYYLQAAPLPGRFGYKTPLSTVLHFSAFGGVFTATSTATVVSTVSTLTTMITASTISPTTSAIISSTSMHTTVTPTPGIPGFPLESIMVGIIGGVFALMLLRRRRSLR